MLQIRKPKPLLNLNDIYDIMAVVVSAVSIYVIIKLVLDI